MIHEVISLVKLLMIMFDLSIFHIWQGVTVAINNGDLSTN